MYSYIDFDRRDRVFLSDSLVLFDDISSCEEKSLVWKLSYLNQLDTVLYSAFTCIVSIIGYINLFD